MRQRRRFSSGMLAVILAALVPLLAPFGLVQAAPKVIEESFQLPATNQHCGWSACAYRCPTGDQIVQIRARPDTLTPTGWFGVMARYVDDGDYYYLKVGAAGQASIRKLVNGAIFELATASFPVSANTWYTLRLESVGNQLRAYIDDRFLMEATDSSHAAGNYGLVTYKAAATFDDVEVKEP